ncbi:MAG: N-acetyltransferase [Bifidobacteriaceae bacterium]|jgi:predicted GNAT family acetyltransferase|nr:N-acetyltransferase [Bifidobacteriaceae bacterium]
MATSPQLTVRNDTEASQYELLADDTVIGVAEYQVQPGALAFVHTVIAPGATGHGLGEALITAALDDARGKGLAVLPYCSFVRHYVETHPGYQDLVPAANRPAFGLPTVLKPAAEDPDAG